MRMNRVLVEIAQDTSTDLHSLLPLGLTCPSSHPTRRSSCELSSLAKRSRLQRLLIRRRSLLKCAWGHLLPYGRPRVRSSLGQTGSAGDGCWLLVADQPPSPCRRGRAGVRCGRGCDVAMCAAGAIARSREKVVLRVFRPVYERRSERSHDMEHGTRGEQSYS